LQSGFIVEDITRNDAMFESRVHPVISRYFFVREVTRLRENLAHLLSLSFAREKSERRKKGRRVREV